MFLETSGLIRYADIMMIKRNLSSEGVNCVLLEESRVCYLKRQRYNFFWIKAIIKLYVA